MAVVKPLCKNGNRKDTENFRPISLLPVFSKVIERVMNIRLTNFITKNDILVEAQNGFRKGKSTETAIQAFLEKNVQSIRKKNKYSRTPVSADLVSAVSVICGLPTENIKWKIPEINNS
jgi:hypothetical protein